MDVPVKTMNTKEFYDIVKDFGIIGVVVFIVKRNASENLLDFSGRRRLTSRYARLNIVGNIW